MVDIKRLNIFKKRNRKAKTTHPDDYYTSKRVGLWVSAGTQRYLKDLAEEASRSILVLVDDIIEEVYPQLLEWLRSKARIEYLKQRSGEEGIRLVHMTGEAMGKVLAYAEGVHISKGQALDEMVWIMVLAIREKKRKEAKRKKASANLVSQMKASMPAQLVGDGLPSGLLGPSSEAEGGGQAINEKPDTETGESLGEDRESDESK